MKMKSLIFSIIVMLALFATFIIGGVSAGEWPKGELSFDNLLYTDISIMELSEDSTFILNNSPGVAIDELAYNTAIHNFCSLTNCHDECRSDNYGSKNKFIHNLII